MQHEAYFPPHAPPLELATDPLKRSLAFLRNPLEGFSPQVYDIGLSRHTSFFMNMWVLTDPIGISEVLGKHSKSFRKSRLNQRIIEPVSKNGLITTHGTQWKKQRRAIAPIFRPRQMDKIAGSVDNVISEFMKKLRNDTPKTIDLKQSMSSLSFDILAMSLLGNRDVGSNKSLQEAANTAIETCGKMRIDDFLPLPEWVPKLHGLKASQAIRELKRGAKKVLQANAKTYEGGETSLVSLLAKHGDNELSEQEQIDNLTGFFIAGHETTAIAMTWALYLIAKHPDTQKRIRHEVQKLDLGHSIKYSDIKSLPFTKAVFYETMRLFPSIPIIGREAIEDVKVFGHNYKKGETIVIPIYVMHRSNRIWERANEFDPDRFLRNPEIASPKNPNYIPFGAGHRVCIGATFAMMESLMMIANLMRNFQIYINDVEPIKPEVTISLRPNKTIWLRYETIDA